MKKMLTMVLGVVLTMVIFSGCVDTTPTGDTSTDNSTTETQQESAVFNPDEEQGVEIGQLRSELGAIPKIEGSIKLGAVAKAFENEYWRTLKEGYEVFQDKLQANGNDVTIDVTSAQGEGDEQGQLSIVKDMINKNYDGLLLSPISDGNLVPGVEDAAKKNIPVVNVNDGLIANANVFVGPKAIQNGELAAEWISNKLGGEGQVAIVIGMPKAFAARQRTAGFEQYIAANASGIEIVAKQNADWDRSKAKDLADTWIKKYPDLKAIFCNNDTMALGVVEAVKSSGKDILVVGVDGIGEAYDSIRKGELDATIDSFPLYKSQIATEVTLRLMSGQNVPRVIWTPQALIDSTNVEMNAEEIISWEEPTFE
jgi:ribose transport system substrate-binding protein